MLLVIQLAGAAEVGEQRGGGGAAGGLLQPLLQLSKQQVQGILTDCTCHLHTPHKAVSPPSNTCGAKGQRNPLMLPV